MAYFADLKPCLYFCSSFRSYISCRFEKSLLAVGWLDSRHKHAHGSVSESFVARLAALLVIPWEPCHFMGWHDCELCRSSFGPLQISVKNMRVNIGITNLFVPGDDKVFVAPSMILHYIDAHEYYPPEVFQNAVMACPEMGSAEYLDAIRKNAPKSLAQLVSV